MTSISPLNVSTENEFGDWSCLSSSRQLFLRSGALEHFPVKWTPVHRKEMRPLNSLERPF
jgi:hypothetical protein